MIYIQVNKRPNLIVQLLLVLFLLESCHNTNIPLHPQLDVVTESVSNYSTLYSKAINSSTLAIENRDFSIDQSSSNKLYLAQNQALYESTKHTYPEIIHQKHDTATTTVKSIGYNLLTTEPCTKLTHPIYKNQAIARPGTRLPKTKPTGCSTITSNTKEASRGQQKLAINPKNILTKGSVIPNTFNHNIITLLKDQICITKEGHQVKFKHSQNVNLQATVLKYYGNKYTLPVIIQPEFNFSAKAIKHLGWQNLYIHILKSCVYIGAMGILGGGKGDKEKEADNEPGEKEVDEKLQIIHKIEDLQNFIEVAAKNAERAKGKNIVLVLGNTGSGKSTIINYLLGSELEQVDNEEGDVIVVPKDPQKEWAKIGHGLTSETFLPSVYATSDAPFLYCDCPGFNDNRTEQEILNTTISTQLIVNAAECVHAIIIVIDVMDLTHGRGAGMRNLSNILSQLLKGHLPPNSLLFVFNNKTGKNMKLDNIHLKVKALEKSVSEQLEKLAKIREQEKGSQQEYDNNCQILSMLKMISANKNNTFIINLFDQFESKNTIETILSGLQAIPKDSFSFSEYDDTRVKFNNQLTEIVADFSEKMMSFLQATDSLRINTERIESCEERIDFFTTQIGLLNPEQKFKNEDRIPELQQQIRAYNQKIHKLEEKKATIRNKLVNLTQEKAELDTDEEVCYWIYNAYGDADIQYNGPPFTRREVSELYWDFVCNWNKVQFEDEYINREEGTYKATYKSYGCFSKKEKFYISIYVKKKDIPSNKARIEQINQELEAEQRVLEEYEQDAQETQRSIENTDALVKYYNKDVEIQRNQIINRKQFLTEELARIERERKSAELSSIKHQGIKGYSEKYLTEKGQLLANVSTIISHGVGGESRLIEKFKEYYQRYTGLLEQGLDYFLSLPEKNLPIYLFCPLRGDIFIDPIITACGHTFSQLELLMWLNKSRTCPTCREPVAESEVKPNLSIREAIDEFKAGEKENS